jgi:hypothetical protein
MNVATAWRFLVAAQDDPVLAAWASVCDGHCPAVASDISPYDAWDAFGYLFNHGLVSGPDYDNTDTKKVFFSGSPPISEIQGVLERARFLPEDLQEKEQPMSDNSFFQKKNSLAPRGNNGDRGLSARRQSSSIGEAFSPRQEVMPHHNGGGGLEAFAQTSPSSLQQGGPLACQDSEPGLHAEVCKPRIHCGECGHELNVKVDHREQDIPGDGDRGPLELIIYFCKCDDCNWVYHSTGSKDPHPAQPPY